VEKGSPPSDGGRDQARAFGEPLVPPAWAPSARSVRRNVADGRARCPRSRRLPSLRQHARAGHQAWGRRRRPGERRADPFGLATPSRWVRTRPAVREEARFPGDRLAVRLWHPAACEPAAGGGRAPGRLRLRSPIRAADRPLLAHRRPSGFESAGPCVALPARPAGRYRSSQPAVAATIGLVCGGGRPMPHTAVVIGRAVVTIIAPGLLRAAGKRWRAAQRPARPPLSSAGDDRGRVGGPRGWRVAARRTRQGLQRQAAADRS
jgi:hypothetical protein